MQPEQAVITKSHLNYGAHLERSIPHSSGIRCDYWQVSPEVRNRTTPLRSGGIVSPWPVFSQAGQVGNSVEAGKTRARLDPSGPSLRVSWGWRNKGQSPGVRSRTIPPGGQVKLPTQSQYCPEQVRLTSQSRLAKPEPVLSQTS